ncbi:MAG: class I SAM-dependent methyltransferase [Paludibacter sp.]|jgi:16S rRNA G966 N2-methylase RsmD|nr:class I SAM-dependent methyltransferase [Paludibacter sp.]
MLNQKFIKKLPTFFANKDIVFPSSVSLEQASSEITAQYKARLLRGNSFADLTSGFGVDCFFIAKNFKSAFYVEKNEELCRCAENNFRILNSENIKIINASAENFLVEMPPVDAIFLDPSRRNNSGARVAFLADCQPNVAELLPLLKQKSAKILLKLAPMLDISKALADLQGTRVVHVISVENECREILFEIGQEENPEIEIKTVNFAKNNVVQYFDFQRDKEREMEAIFARQIEKYLYEPNASIMKAGGFKTVAQRFDIRKLDVNTHLYTSDNLIENFAGRIFAVQNTLESSRQTYKMLKTNYRQANIAVRNYPSTVAEIRRKTGIKDGGETYIFACTLKGKKMFLICKKKYTDNTDDTSLRARNE